jgi:hypothetical protein
LLDVFLLVVLVASSYQLVSYAIRRSRAREQVAAVAPEARALYSALRKYRERNGSYPDEHANPPFDPVTFEPLRRRGYYHGAIGRYLLDGHVDAYDAPDDQGPNREFYLEMTLVSDPSIRILIARSDDAPLGRGNWTDGVFVVQGGKLEPL